MFSSGNRLLLFDRQVVSDVDNVNEIFLKLAIQK